MQTNSHTKFYLCLFDIFIIAAIGILFYFFSGPQLQYLIYNYTTFSLDAAHIFITSLIIMAISLSVARFLSKHTTSDTPLPSDYKLVQFFKICILSTFITAIYVMAADYYFKYDLILFLIQPAASDMLDSPPIIHPYADIHNFIQYAIPTSFKFSFILNLINTSLIFVIYHAAKLSFGKNLSARVKQVRNLLIILWIAMSIAAFFYNLVNP